MAIACQLVCHASTPTTALDGVEVTADRLPGERLKLDYTLRGNRGAIVWQMRAEQPQRRDELWRETCFEAFVMGGEGPGYVELNFAFSHDWAAYWFTGEREGMADLAMPAPQFDPSGASGDLSVVVDLSGAGLLPHADWRVGLAAVLIDRRGETSYWALAHPDGAPDFHDPACFEATLAAPREA